MITLAEVMEMTAIPEKAKEKLLELEAEPGVRRMEECMKKTIPMLTEPEHWEEARGKIRASVSPDPDGWKMLYFMLQAVRSSHEKYSRRGITDEVFTATMCCFSRFVSEYKKIYGRYGFDRDFWTGRQLSLKLFRLGELEYEETAENGNKAVSIHIPSDAVISKENCRHSIETAYAFFKEQDEEYADTPYYCESWLLSPALKKLLPDTSKIIQFQNLFAIQETDEDSMEYMYWIFQSDGKNPDALPEHTTLQRRAKQYLLDGRKIGNGKGVLKPFS